MSLLRRLQNQTNPTPPASPFGNPPDEEDEELEAPKKPELSGLLQLFSAWTAWPHLKTIPALKPLAENVQLSAAPRCPEGAWAVVSPDGTIYADPHQLAPLESWAFVLGHLLVHLGQRHRLTSDPIRMAAQEASVNTLLSQLNVGIPPDGFLLPSDERTDAEAIYADWQRNPPAIPAEWRSAAGINQTDLLPTADDYTDDGKADRWAILLTEGLLQQAGGTNGKGRYQPWVTAGMSQPKQAIRWFIDHFPLLSALAAHFQIVEDPDTIRALDINIAAVIAKRMEIFVNPDAHLNMAEMRFVMAHEMLHVGLLHHKREEDRDHFVWNVACDFVINAWLKEMGVGEMPRGGLYDPSFAGLSSEQIYERLMKDAKYVRALRTFRGAGLGDMLPEDARGGARQINGKPIDDDLAEQLMKEGIDAHTKGGRGLLPAGLMEMVTPTVEAPPAWKLSLTKWFDARFEPSAPARSYARLSRRQQATPDIPRPRYAVPQFPDGSGVFGVLLDTSGSMQNALLARCLGALAALAIKHRIQQVRLVLCDAAPHDEGYVPVEKLLKPYQLKGRGGTRLQTGIDLLVEAHDFPKDAPILVITDGDCDVLTIKREHAFLIPENKRLPFPPTGPVFKLS